MEKTITVTYELTTTDERVTEDWVNYLINTTPNLIYELEAFNISIVEVETHD